ncbi:TMC5_1 protein, partial [Gryllus bimaculatus]
MRHLYHRGSIPTIQRINTLRHALARELGEEDEAEYLPLQDLNEVRVRQARRVAFEDTEDFSSPMSAHAGSNHEHDSITSYIQDASCEYPLEQAAVKIVNAMEKDNSLMRDNPLSEQRRLDTLREMPESLTLKRTIRRKLINRVNKKQGGSPLGVFKRLRYQFSMSITKFNDLIKDMIYSCELWYSSIKVIEGHYGSGVATFFRFFRSLFIMNCIVFFISHSFLVIPQILYDHLGTVSCNLLWNNSSVQNISSLNSSLEDMIDTTIFSDEEYYGEQHVPTFHMAKSYRKSFIETSQGIKNIYAHKIFCGWDFGIATEESAILKSKSILNELKELLSEDEKSDMSQNCKMRCHIIGVRICVHILSTFILIFTGGVIWFLLSANLGYDEERTYQSSMMMSLIVTIIMMISPVIFSWIVRFEEYRKPRTALYFTLVRTFQLGMVVISVLLAFWLKRSKADTQECWETSLGQEVYRLILVDFLIAILGTALAEFVRKRIYLTLWRKIGQPEFDIARNTLNLIYNETLFFVGFFFCPPASLIIIIKMFITFYIKKIGALKNCQPSEHSWRAAQTQTVFLVLSFISMLSVIIVYGYILMNVKASDCGPFRGYPSMYEMILEEIFQLKQDHAIIKVFVYITKPGVVAGILIGIVVVYYLRAQSQAHIHMVDILREMLHLEAKDKDFLLSNITKVSEGGWIYGNKRNYDVQHHSNKLSGTTNSEHGRSEGSYSSSSSTQRVSEWLLKSTRSVDPILDSSTSSTGGDKSYMCVLLVVAKIKGDAAAFYLKIILLMMAEMILEGNVGAVPTSFAVITKNLKYFKEEKEINTEKI